MSIDDCAKLLAWLQNIFPRQYSAKMTDARRDDLLDVLETAYEGYSLDEVQAAYKAIIKTYDNGAPEIAMVRNRLQTMRIDRNNEQDNKQQDERKRAGLPEHHPYNGCYTHHEAYVHYLDDMRHNNLQGKFSDYCRRYPAVVWKPWANPDLNRYRIDDPKGPWHYMKGKPYGGWTTNENGFCVPKVAHQ